MMPIPFIPIGAIAFAILVYASGLAPQTHAVPDASSIPTAEQQLPSRTPTVLARAGDVEILAFQPPEDGVYKGITVRTPSRDQTFAWSTSSNETYAPAVSLTDLTGDNKNELTIILTKGYGTGVLEQEIHVLNPEDVTEIPLENPLEAVREQVSASMTPSDDSMILTLQIDNKGDVVKLYDASYAAVWLDRPGYGSILKYEVRDNRLWAYVSVSVSPAELAGMLAAEYDTGLKIKDLNFEEQIR